MLRVFKSLNPIRIESDGEHKRFPRTPNIRATVTESRQNHSRAHTENRILVYSFQVVIQQVYINKANRSKRRISVTVEVQFEIVTVSSPLNTTEQYSTLLTAET